MTSIENSARANAAKLGFEKARTVYLAGPEVFLPDTAAIGTAKKQICAEYGLVGIFPIDTDINIHDYAPRDAGLKISEKNEEIMRVADTIVANATPWPKP